MCWFINQKLIESQPIMRSILKQPKKIPSYIKQAFFKKDKLLSVYQKPSFLFESKKVNKEIKLNPYRVCGGGIFYIERGYPQHLKIVFVEVRLCMKMI